MRVATRTDASDTVCPIASAAVKPSRWAPTEPAVLFEAQGVVLDFNLITDDDLDGFATAYYDDADDHGALSGAHKPPTIASANSTTIHAISSSARSIAVPDIGRGPRAMAASASRGGRLERCGANYARQFSVGAYGR